MIKVILNENNKALLTEGSALTPEELRMFLDAVLGKAPGHPGRPIIGINPNTGGFSVTPSAPVSIEPKGSGRVRRGPARTHRSGAPKVRGLSIRNIEVLPDGDIKVNSSLRGHINTRAKPPVGGFSPDVQAWFDDAKIVGEEVEQALGRKQKGWRRLAGSAEFRHARGDFRTLTQRLADRIKGTLKRGWERIRLTSGREFRVYQRQMRVIQSPPMTSAGRERLAKAARKDLAKARAKHAKTRVKIVRDIKRTGTTSARLKALSAKQKNVVRALYDLEKLLASSKYANKTLGQFLKAGIGKTAAGIGKLVPILGWASWGFVAQQAYEECRRFGATKQEAFDIMTLGESVVPAHQEAFFNSMSKLEKDYHRAWTKVRILRGRTDQLGAPTPLGPFTEKDAQIIKRSTKYLQSRTASPQVKKAWAQFGSGASEHVPVGGDLQETKNYQRSKKIKIKINS
jgi:hypothetical protein